LALKTMGPDSET